MPLSYSDALDHWDRSKAFGDPRDFPTFAGDMETLHPGQGFGEAGSRDGWWTRLSTRLDQNVFKPVADATTAPLGEAIGGVFGAPEVGRRVGEALPRTLLETAPLYALGPEAGVPATVAALGGTGALMGAHTYADTGSAKAALISGATGAVLPGVGRIGGGLATRLLASGERVAGELAPEVGEAATQPFNAFLPKTAADVGRFKAAHFVGSQAAMIGANEASMYATDKTLGQPFDPMSPDFWAQQIPFTVFDAVHGMSGKMPSAEEVKPQLVQRKAQPTKTYVPPTVSQPEADATITSTLQNLQTVYSDPMATAEQKAAALAATNAVVQDPTGATKLKKEVAQPEASTEVTGFARPLLNGNYKVLTTDAEGNEKTVFVNGVKPTENPDGTFTFKASASQVSDAVTSPLKREDFVKPVDPTQPDLPPQKQEWQGFPPDAARTLEENGVKGPYVAEHQEIAEGLEQAQQDVSEARAKVATVPQSAEEVPGVVGDVEKAKPTIELAIKSGATPTQTVEKARLTTQTPAADEALQQLAVLREQAKTISTTATGKPQAVYGDYIRNEDGENFPNRGFAEAYRDAHPEYEGYVVRAAGKGSSGFYLARQINKEVSLEGAKLEKVLVDPSGSTALESRPDVSFDAALTQIDRASKSPRVFANEAGFDDVSDAILALRQARVVMPMLREGKTFEEIQAALAEAKVAGFTSPRNAVAVMQSVRDGLAGFQDVSRNFALDSKIPYDQKLVDSIGIMHPTEGLKNALNAYINSDDPATADVRELLGRVFAVQGTEGVRFVVDSHVVSPQYDHDNRVISTNYLPTEENLATWNAQIAHEYLHDVTKGLKFRTDPAAVQLKAIIAESRDALAKSPLIPARVRGVIPKAVEWYREYSKATNSEASQEFYDKWHAAVGEGQDEWLHVVYGLSHEDELLPSMFSSQKLLELATKTQAKGPERSTVLQKISTWFNRMFGGKAEGDSVLAKLLTGFDQYLSGSKVPPRDVAVGPKLPAGANFFYGLSDYDPSRNVLGGKHKLPNDGRVTEQQLKSMGGIGKPLSDGEVELYKSLVPEAWDGGKVNVPKLVEGLGKKGPVVETKKLGGLNKSNDIEQLQHELETIGPAPIFDDNGELTHLQNRDGSVLELDDPNLSPRVKELVQKIKEIGWGYNEESSPNGPRYSFLGPKPESEMPGYVEGLVRVPVSGERKLEHIQGKRPARDLPLYSGPHFGSEDTNVLAFYRGYEETLPTGEKAFHVIEVQSDWGQKVRDFQEQWKGAEIVENSPTDYFIRTKGGSARGGFNSRAEAEAFLKDGVSGTKFGNEVPSHPLLRVYESLALKAAIAHAKEIGATKVILSDGETAMMTEGHDRAARPVATDTGFAREEPSQSAGMRLHYDQTLPSAMEKLTGDRGTPVDVGTHKGAGLNSGGDAWVGQHNMPRDVAERELTMTQSRYPNVQYELRQTPEGWGVIRPEDVGSPVFRNPDGTPKSSITGRVYDINKIPDQQTLFENKPPSVNVRQSYNGRDFLRDNLIASGVRPEALASRIDTIQNLFNTGNLQHSIDGFTREMSDGTLPATAEAGPLKPEVTTALTSGEPKEVRQQGLALLANEVPVHQELLQRMKEDVETAVKLYSNIKKGLIPGELPPTVREALQQAHVRVDALGQALDKQGRDISRFNDLSNFTNEGMEQTRVLSLSSDRLPAPPDPTEMQKDAQEALGLVEARREVSRTALERGKVAGASDWLRRTFMFTQYLKQIIPATRPAFDHVFQLQGETNFWKNELDAVYGMDPKNVGEMDKGRVEANRRVATNETLMRAASDIKLWNQTEEAAGREPSLDDPFVKNTLARFNPKDRADIVSEANNARAVHDHWTDVTAPRFFARKNMLTVAKVIALREQGMTPEQARDLAGQFTSAIDQLKNPQTAQQGLEMLNVLRPSMQPDTYLAAFGLAKGLADDTTEHLEFMKSRPNYVTEQRVDGKHAIRMVTPDNKPFFNTYGNRQDALAAVTRLEAKGYKYLEYVPAQDLNVPYRGVDTEVIGKLRELDMQRQNREAQALQGLDPAITATVLNAFNRANDYDESLAAFSPVPGAGYPKRHFVAGREELNMVQQQNMFYGRATNWMRHQLTRAETELDLLHPDLLADRQATKLVRDHVGNVLTPDSQLARKMAEFTYNWKLAGNFGVNVLHTIQSLNTGMAALIAETGGVGEALGLTMAAQKAVIQRVATGKWANADHEWLDKRASAEGISGYASWEGDIGDSNRNALQFASTPTWQKPLEGLKYAARSWNNFFFRFNDRIGLISAYDLAKSRGMGDEEAFGFARDVKNQGYFTGGKAQRSVNQWAAFGPQAKAVPQLMSSLQTYVQGWFSLLASNYIKGFGRAPEGLTSVQISGAKKAFMYQLGAQVVLAGALGLPGVGQGMALVKQTTGLDVMSWLRQNLGSLFDEDQQAGGLVTTLALHGATSAFTPIDMSGRHMPSVPYIGVTPYKGFDLANLAGAPVSSAADLVKGLMAAAKGDTQGMASLLPEVLRGPLRLWQGEGDARDKSGNLIAKLSPSEQFVTALGMKPSRVTALQDVATAVKEANLRASAEKGAISDNLATIYRKNGVEQGHAALIKFLQDHPDQDGKSLVREVARKVQAQTTVPDWSQKANVGADISGLGGDITSQAGRYSQLQGIQSSLGLPSRPNPHVAAMADQVDLLRQTDPYLGVAEATALARSQRPVRQNTFVGPTGFQ